MTKPVITESVVEMALELIHRRNKLVKRQELVRNQISALSKATQGVLSVNGKDLQVLVTPDAFDFLTKPFTDEIEELNSKLKKLGIVTIDEETAT
jgi:hypothetical protein